MVTSTYGDLSCFSEYTILYKFLLVLHFERVRWCTSVWKVQIKTIGHVVDENVP